MNNPLKSLEQRFPYQFRDHIGINIARGWAEGFTKLCEDIDRIAAGDPDGRHYGFHWRQVKEKFGTARLYYRLDGSGTGLHLDFIGSRGVQTATTKEPNDAGPVTDPKRAIADLVLDAESRMAEICIVCGSAPAKLDATGGHVLNLCAHHAQQRLVDRRSMDTPWFEV